MMSVRPDDEADFTRWLDRTRSLTSATNTYVSRPTFGSYLRDSLSELRRIWDSRDGLLHCVPEEVVVIAETAAGRYRLETSGALYRDYDHVILCVGWRTDDLSHSEGGVRAYPLAPAVERGAGCKHVGIIGTGLTSIDVVRGLLLRGFDGKITAASRRGLLPSARNEVSSLTPELYTRSALSRRDGLDLRESMALIEAEAHHHAVDLSVPKSLLRGDRSRSMHIEYLNSGLHDGWSDLFVKLCDEVACDSWNLFDATSRRIFRQVIHPYFQAWCNPMPPVTARLVRDAIESGQLEVRAGLEGFNEREMRFSDGDIRRPQLIVNASRGGSDSIGSTRTPLLSSMLNDGYAVPDAFGGVQVEYGTWEVLSATGRSQRLYAVGSLTQGARYYVSALDSIVRAVREVAHAIEQRRGEQPVALQSSIAGS